MKHLRKSQKSFQADCECHFETLRRLTQGLNQQPTETRPEIEPRTCQFLGKWSTTRPLHTVIFHSCLYVFYSYFSLLNKQIFIGIVTLNDFVNEVSFVRHLLCSTDFYLIQFNSNFIYKTNSYKNDPW